MDQPRCSFNVLMSIFTTKLSQRNVIFRFVKCEEHRNLLALKVKSITDLIIRATVSKYLYVPLLHACIM